MPRWSVLIVVILGGGAPRGLAASEITTNASIGVARSHPTNPDLYAIWMRSSAGQVVSATDSGAYAGGRLWRNHGAAGAVSTEGVATTSYTDGNASFQYVYHVSTASPSSSTVYEGFRATTGGDSAVTWTSFVIPSARLTGSLAATTFTYQGRRYTAVAFTTSSGQLKVLTRDVAGSAAWADRTGGLTWSPTFPLAATTNPSETIASFFGSHTTGGATRLAMVRWKGSSWATFDLGAPAGKRVCNSISAAQDQLNASTYRLGVGCTDIYGTANLYVAEATSETSTAFTWTTLALPTTVPLDRGNVVAAVARGYLVPAKAIDAFVLHTNGHVSRATRAPTSWEPVADMGLIYQADQAYGGLGAAPWGPPSRFARLFFIGEQNQRSYLYERRGVNDNSPWQYRSAGAGERRDVVDSGGQRAEGMVADWHGTVTACLINRPGTGGPTDWPRVHSFFSNDDGDTWTAAPAPGVDQHTRTVGGTTYSYITDPTCAVTKTRRVYTMMMGLDLPQCASVSANKGAIFMDYTDNLGASFSAPILVRESMVGGLPVDHPFLAIEHRSTQPDRLHIAWAEQAAIKYAYYDDGVGLSTIRELRYPLGSAPRIAANDFGEVFVTYYYYPEGTIKICKLNATLNGCLVNGDPQCNDQNWCRIPSLLDSSGVSHLIHNQNTPVSVAVAGDTCGSTRTDHVCMRTGAQGYSIAPSQTSPGRLYYCFHARELPSEFPGDADADEETDVYCAPGQVDATGVFSWGQAVLINLAANDDRDQFMPEVFVTREDDHYLGQETVIVRWYDRSASPSNYSYRVNQTMSFDGGLSYPFVTALSATDSDPDLLPRHCWDSRLRFIGDYSATLGSDLHGHSLYVTTPGAPIATDVAMTFDALGAGN